MSLRIYESDLYELEQPWKRLTGEGSKAYEAFLTYLHLGPGRTLIEAYRQYSGKKEAKGATGNFNSWSSKFFWVYRCASYDASVQEAQIEAVKESARFQSYLWDEKRQRYANEAIAIGEQMMKQAKVVLSFPMYKKSTQQTGDFQTTTIEAINAKEGAAASLMGLRGYLLIRAAIDHAAPQTADSSDYRNDPEFSDFNAATCEDPQKLERFLEKYGNRSRSGGG